MDHIAFDRVEHINHLLYVVDPLGTNHLPGTDEAIRFYFRYGTFPAPEYLEAAVRRHLLTTDQEDVLLACRLTVGDILRGKYPPARANTVRRILNIWNAAIGFPKF